MSIKEAERKRDGAMEILRNGRIRKNITIISTDCIVFR